MTVRIAAPADYTCKGDSETDPVMEHFCRRASALRLQNETSLSNGNGALSSCANSPTRALADESKRVDELSAPGQP